MSVSKNHPVPPAPSRQGLPHSEMRHFVIHLEEDVLRRIRAVAETKGKNQETLTKEFIIERLREEEKRGGIPVPSVKVHGATGQIPKSELVDIYTDGGCRGNPGPGGWAAVVYEGPKPKEIYGAEKNTTNQRMELRAAIEGLQYLKEPSRVRLYSDSAYLLNAMNKGWLVNWEHNGWKKADKEPVKNADLWRDLLELAKIHEVEWVKVKGHAGNPGNERCDTLVQLAIDRGRRRV